MKRLWSRAVESLAPEPPKADEGEESESGAVPAIQPIPVVDPDAEPRKLPIEPQRIQLPSLIQGTIERPGDIDRVKFSVKTGDRLVFEVETPEKTIPIFNPYLKVIDENGVEAFTNVYSRINANSVISKQIRPKTAYSFSRGGEFTLEIRDITASYGDAAMSYRVLVRPQVPHVGKVHIAKNYLNLMAGEAAKLSVITDQEEGFEGFAILTLEGLPQGVTAMPGTEVEPDKPPPFNEGKKERYTTKSRKATFILVTDADAPPTRMPVMARVFAQPVMEGKPGRKIPVKDVLVMVVRPLEVLTESRPQRKAAGR
jgi:hypothetical protein